MMHHRSQRYGHHGGGVVNPFRGGSSRLTYADPRYNKIGGNGGGSGSSSPRNSRWHSSAAGKCAVLAITFLYLSYSTIFAPAPPATPNKAPSSPAGGTTPTGLLSSPNNNKAPSPPTTPASTDGGSKASLPQPPPLAQPATPGLVDPKPLAERLEGAKGGGGGGNLADVGGVGSGSRDVHENESRFGEEDPKERGVSSPETGGEVKGEEDEEDDDMAGEGRPPGVMMMKKHNHQGDDNKAEDEDDDRQRGGRGGETRGSNEGEGDGDATSMFQRGDNKSPAEGGSAASGEGTGGNSMGVPVIKDVTPESEPRPSGSEEAKGNDSRETDTAETAPGDVTEGGGAENGNKDGFVDTEESSTTGDVKVEPSERATASNDGSKHEEIPVVIPLPRDSKSMGATEDGSPESEGQLHQPGDNGEGEGEGEGEDIFTSKDSGVISATALDGLNPSAPSDANETEHSEVDTTETANLHGQEDSSDPTPSSPEVGEAVGKVVENEEHRKGGPELAAVDSPQQRAEEGLVREEAEASNTTVSTDKANESASATLHDALATELNGTLEDELAKVANDTIASPLEQNGQTDNATLPGTEHGEIPAASEGDHESSANEVEGGKSGNNLLLQGNADAVTADSAEEGNGGDVPDASIKAANETVSSSTGTTVDSPDEVNARDSAQSETADENSKGGVPPVAGKDGGTVESESERLYEAEPDQKGGDPEEANEARTSERDVGSNPDEPAEQNITPMLQPANENGTEQKLPSEIATENHPVASQATSDEEADTVKEGGSKEIGEPASKNVPVPPQNGSGDGSDAAHLEGSKPADKQEREETEAFNDTATETDKNDPDASDPESAPKTKKGKKRRKDSTTIEVDASETIAGEDIDGDNTSGKDEETKKKSRKRKGPKQAAGGGKDEGLPETKDEAAGLDGVDLAKDKRSKKDKAKSHLRGAGKDVEQTI